MKWFFQKSKKNLRKYSDEDEYWDVEDHDVDEYGFDVDEEGLYFTQLDVPVDLMSIVIGRRGENVKRIERTSKCTIEMPRHKSGTTITIRANRQDAVDRGKTQILLSIEGKRFKRQPGYFLSLSLAVQS